MFNLALTAKEAKTLKVVLQYVSGPPTLSLRKYTDTILEQLYNLDCDDYRSKISFDSNGITFVSNDQLQFNGLEAKTKPNGIYEGSLGDHIVIFDKKVYDKNLSELSFESLPSILYRKKE